MSEAAAKKAQDPAQVLSGKSKKGVTGPSNPFAHLQEQLTATAFSRQAPVFDELYSTNTIVNYKRERVRRHVLQFLAPGSSILELNAGTGEDAIFFAGNGFSVHATDISDGMQRQLEYKVDASGLRRMISNELCSFTQLKQLKNKGPFDMVFSNFAGLNCTAELDKVLLSLAGLLKPGGVATLVILPQFCLWETLLMFKGKFRTAFRRFFSSNGRVAHLEGTYFRCWYYNPSYVVKTLQGTFTLLDMEGLCCLVPPSYIEYFAEKYPRVYSFLKAKEDKLKSRWPWRLIGDYYIISLRKND